MTEIGQYRLNERLTRYRYLHCRMRVQARYNLELTEQEYEQLCSDFRTNRVRNSWQTDTGATEAWILFKSKLVCPHFRPSEGLITTFQVAPDLEPEVPAPIAAVFEQHALVKALRERVVGLEAKVRTLSDALTREQNKQTPNYGVRTSKWFKSKLQAIAPLIRDGKLIEALARIQALGSLPKHFVASDLVQADTTLTSLVEYQTKKLAEIYEEVKA